MTHGLVLLLHRVTVLVAIPRLIACWMPVSNHPSIAGVPVGAGFFALTLLRDAGPHCRGRSRGAAAEA